MDLTGSDCIHVVYQMGKVGSSTVYESFRTAGVPRLFKVHYLSDQGLARARRLYDGLPVRVPVPHEESSVALRQWLTAGSGGPCWKVLTLVREPIARDVSAFVQMVDLLQPSLVAGPVPDVARIARAASAQFLGFQEERNYTCQWFEEEFHRALDVDVFSRPFDAERGWQRIRTGWLDIAVVRLEDLSRVLESVALALTGLRVSMVYASARSPEKWQAAYEERTYQRILDRVRVPADVCRSVYRSRYSRHFYTADEIDRFVEHWSR